MSKAGDTTQIKNTYGAFGMGRMRGIIIPLTISPIWFTYKVRKKFNGGGNNPPLPNPAKSG